MLRSFFIGLLGVLVAVPLFAASQQITVMSYNLENFFDPEVGDHPALDDREFTPEGRQRWTEEKFKEKMELLTEVVTSVEGGCPDVLGVVEVESMEVLKRWSKEEMPECNLRHIFVYQPVEGEPNEADSRGIKVAVMSRFPIAELKDENGQPDGPKLHPVYRGARYILEVPLDIDGNVLRVFVNHWKSRAGRDTEEKRMRSARVLRQRLEQLNHKDPYSDILVLGDFNDEPENKSVLEGLNVKSDIHEVYDTIDEVVMWNSVYDWFNLPEVMAEARKRKEKGEDIDLRELERKLRRARSTYYYYGGQAHNMLDHIILSRGLLDDQGLGFVSESYRVLKVPGFVETETGASKTYQYVTRDGEIIHVGGASDHFPVVINLQYENVSSSDWWDW